MVSASAPPMSQLNIRLESSLKAAGDAVLSRAGVSPTELIRAVWAKIACGEEALAQVAQALLQEPTPAAPPVRRSSRPGDALVQGIERRQSAFEEALGLDAASYTPPTEEEMAEMLFDEMRERESERLV